MKLNDFGLIVKYLRKNSFDKEGNRWTRETLSRAVHLTEDQLGRLERGDRKYLDNQTLMLLADSFNLTSLERKEFFYAALGLKDEELFNQETPETQLLNLFETLEQLQAPLYLIDVYSDLVAANKAIKDLFQLNMEEVNNFRQSPLGLNLLHLIYSPQFGLKDLIGPDWREAAMMAILEFRRSSLRYRHTNYFQYLLNSLLENKHFKMDWSSSHRFSDYYDLTYEHFEYEHPGFGPLAYTATETIINTMKGELNLIIYNPADSNTVSVFNELFKNAGNQVLQLAGWPK